MIEYLQQQRMRWLRLNQTKDRFLATLGHELRVPLNRAHLLMTSCLTDSSLPAATQHILREILETNELQQVIINDVLDMARIENRKLIISPHQIELAPLIKSTLNLIEDEAKQKDITINFNQDDQHIWVYVDASRIKQVFWNVIRNAIKFSPPPPEKVSIFKSRPMTKR